MELVKSNLGGEIVYNAQREFVSGLQSLGEVVDILKESDVNDSTPAVEIMKLQEIYLCPFAKPTNT